MVQIAVWGMAIMLVVKGLDVLHRDAIARANGNGSINLAVGIFIVSLVGAVFLVVVAGAQAMAPPAYGPEY